MKYTGAKCSACGEVFTDNDDVVVCPECGTPHHRRCYRTNGECVNTVRHGGDFRWTDSRRSQNPPADTQVNETPSGENAGTAENVRIEFKSIDDFVNENIKELDKNKKDDCSLREVLDFVHKNVLYYMSVFAGIRNMGRNVSFNLPCFICPPLQFAYRKMWFWAVLTSVFSVILIIPMMISLIASDSGLVSARVAETINSNADTVNLLTEICSGADLIMRVLLCLFGNRLYYNFTVKSIKRIKKQCGEDITKEQLISAGGTKAINVVLIMLVMFALTFCTLSLLQLILPMIF